MAFSSSMPLSLICPKGKIGFSSNNHCMLGKWSAARCCASSFNRRALGTTATTAIEPLPKQESSSPWLMLPPEFEAGGKTTSYEFYNLADNKVQTLSPNDEIGDLRLTCRGSSHGWLALLSQQDDGFFLYNPISGRHIKLPSILNLPTSAPPPKDILTSARYVSKVILSCSPDEDEENCRVLILRGSGNPLAFCCPGRSKDWTLMFDDENRRCYEDCVYSTRLKLFFVINSHISTDSYISTVRYGEIFKLKERKLETWDLGDLSSPKLIKVDKCNYFTTMESFFWYNCVRNEYLVVVDEDLLLVIQYILFSVGPDGSHYDDDDDRYKYETIPDGGRYMTIGFEIFKYDDSEKGKFKYLDRSSLGDLAIFVGKHNHSVAIQATEFPGVKPNSIYFTDGIYTGELEGNESNDWDDYFWGSGHDIGIFNYQDKTVSQCYYPCDVQGMKIIVPAPIWFFPN
ncbi:hypothetical protein CASFOL_009000 [Castilleja foliolosa]|uniref:KIB1-4 beta-propeller domain-containing protein n=1 Tax=Castilleja foliolosa TaxID=1961234 RepID=A0ABD3E212_9LAMI